jgi:signal peptidase I
MGNQSGGFLKFKILPAYLYKYPGQNDIRFVAYAGESMNPTLREPELLEVWPYHDNPICRGDVIYFVQQETGVVHRVTAITGQGVTTRGDNNPTADTRVLPVEQIIGRVVAVLSGSKRRVMLGGWRGHLLGNVWHGFRWLDHFFPHYLSPVYRWLCDSRFFSRILPENLRPRVIHFQGKSGVRLFLFWGGILIGRYVDDRHQWIIRRPFRLILNEHCLITPPNGKVSS